MICTCSPPISPRRCAAAVCDNTGSRASPDSAVRGPKSCAWWTRRCASAFEIRNRVASAAANVGSPNSSIGTSASAATRRCVIAGSRRVNLSHSWAAAVRCAVASPSSLGQQRLQLSAQRRDPLGNSHRTHTSNTSSNHRQVSAVNRRQASPSVDRRVDAVRCGARHRHAQSGVHVERLSRQTERCAVVGDARLAGQARRGDGGREDDGPAPLAPPPAPLPTPPQL